MRNNVMMENERDQEFLDSVTEDEIMACWRFYRGTRISPYETWQAIVTGIALDMVFGKSKTIQQIIH